MDSLDELFWGTGPKRGADREATVRDLHAKTGVLTVERDFFCASWGAEPFRAGWHDLPWLRAVLDPTMRAVGREPFFAVPGAIGRKRGESFTDAPARRIESGAPSAARGDRRRPAPGVSISAARFGH